MSTRDHWPDEDVLEHPARTTDHDFGPQGAALILELQRLRESFVHHNWSEARAPQPHRSQASGARSSGAERHRVAQRPKKGRMGRIVEVCLGKLRLNAGASVDRQSRSPQHPHAATAKLEPQARLWPNSAPRPRRPVTLFEPIKIELSNPALEISALPRSAPAEVPQLEQPRVDGARKPDARLGRLIKVGRASVAYLLSRDEPAGAGDSLASRTGHNFEQELKVGLRVLVAVAVIAGGWAALMPLAGAVVVPGNLVVQSNVKAIQHPTGGVVAEIPIRNGMRVNAGDLLLRLDATQAQASLQVVSKQLDEFRARSARLVAERDGLAQPDLPDELAPRLGESAVKSLLAAEATLFHARATARDSQKELLRNRIAQLNEEIAGLEAQVGSKAKQIELIAGELTGVQELYDKHLVPLARLTALQRETARIEGERGQLMSAIAETKAKIGEGQLQIVRLDQDFRTDVVKELGEVKGKEAELVERAVAARDLLDRIELRAPTSGIIHQLKVHTIGGVIRAGDTIMEVVPDTDDLLVEARLQPKDIDQIRSGQTAFVRFSAFNQRTTPQLAGTVSFVSADTSRDQQTNAPYFTVQVVLPDDERRRMGNLQLVPGMPAEVFMQTGSRTMMSYLLKPITEQMHRAFVEQ
jgi:HlyD family secretion protein